MKTYMKYMQMSTLAISMLYSTIYADNSTLIAVSKQRPTAVVFASSRQLEAALIKTGILPIVARNKGIEKGIADYLGDQIVSAKGLKAEVERALARIRHNFILAQDWNALRDLMRGRASTHLLEIPKIAKEVQKYFEVFPVIDADLIAQVLLEEAECHKEEINAPTAAKVVQK